MFVYANIWWRLLMSQLTTELRLLQLERRIERVERKLELFPPLANAEPSAPAAARVEAPHPIDPSRPASLPLSASSMDSPFAAPAPRPASSGSQKPPPLPIQHAPMASAPPPPLSAPEPLG